MTEPWRQLTGRARTARNAGCCSRSTTSCRPIDARTGLSIPTFGVDGIVDLRAELPSRRQDGLEQQQCGQSLAESVDPRVHRPAKPFISPPGDIRAYDVDHRQESVAVPHCSAARRVRLRNLAEGGLPVCRRRQRLGLDVDR